MNKFVLFVIVLGLTSCGADPADTLPLSPESVGSLPAVDAALMPMLTVSPAPATTPKLAETPTPAKSSQAAPPDAAAPEFRRLPDAGVPFEAGMPIPINFGQNPAASLVACPPPKAAMPTNIALGKASLLESTVFPTPAAAFDGDLKTNSGRNENRDGYLAVDFGVEKTLYRSVIRFVGETTQRYKIQVSSDANVWTDILRVYNPNYNDERVLPAIGARYVRFLLTQNSATGEDPSVLNPVSEIEIYEREVTDRPAACAPILYPKPLDRTGWKASSNAGFSPQNAVASASQGFIDPISVRAASSSWLVRAGAIVGSYVAVDMGAPRTFNQIDAPANHDPLREYKIYVSDDGTTWGMPIAAGHLVPTGGYYYAPISFPPQTKRHFKIESQIDTKGRYWGFSNISALNTEGASQRDLGDTVNIALNKATMGSAVKNPAAVFDGDDMTGVDDAGLVQVDLGATYPLARFNVKFRSTDGGFTYRIQSSNDGVTWIPRQSVFMSLGSGRLFTGVVMVNYSARFLRFAFGPSHPHNVDVKQKLNEIEIYRSVGSQAVGREPL